MSLPDEFGNFQSCRTVHLLLGRTRLGCSRDTRRSGSVMRVLLVVRKQVAGSRLAGRKKFLVYVEIRTEAAKCLNARNTGLNAVDCSRREMRGFTMDSCLLVASVLKRSQCPSTICFLFATEKKFSCFKREFSVSLMDLIVTEFHVNSRFRKRFERIVRMDSLARVFHARTLFPEIPAIPCSLVYRWYHSFYSCAA